MTATQPDTPALPAPRRSRWRTILAAIALLATGGVIGAVVTAPTFGQGWYRGGPDRWSRDDDGPGWRDRDDRRGGWRDDGPRWRDDGPRWRDEGSRWRDHGPRGWRDGGGGGMHGGGMHGGFMPGRMERMVDRVLWSVDATKEQRDKVSGIFERAMDDVVALRQQHLDGRRQIREALAAPTVDRGRIETIRNEQLKLADTASKRITDAFADAAEVLTPDQRSQLSRRIERWQRWFRG